MSHSKVLIYNISANFYEDKAMIGDMSPFILFDGDNDAKADKHGLHVAKTEVARKAGAGQVSWTDRVELRLKGPGITVQAKASKTLMPDKVIGEGQANIGGGGQQTVQLVDPKTGNVSGEVSFEVQSDGAGAGGLGASGAGAGTTAGTGYGAGTGAGTTGTGYGAGTGAGYNTAPGQGVAGGTTGQGYGTTGTGVGGGQGYSSDVAGQGYGATGTGVGGGQGYGGDVAGQGYGTNAQQGVGTGYGGAGTGVGGGIGSAPQEFSERKAHNVADHNESNTFEQRTIR